MNLSDKLTGRTGYGQYYQRIRMALSQPKTKITGLASLSIFTVLFFITFAIMPTIKTIGNLTKEIADTKQIEAKLQQKIHSLETAEALYSKAVPSLKIINQLLPPTPDFERLAWQLNWLADQHQVTLSNGAFGEFPLVGPDKNPPGQAASIEVNLLASGNYLSIKSFITALNNIDRLVQVEEITFNSKSSPATIAANITANIKLIVYYYPLL